jgi:hypothetical protein
MFPGDRVCDSPQRAFPPATARYTILPPSNRIGSYAKKRRRNGFKKNIEENKLLLYREDGRARHEVFAQRLFFAVADAYCDANNVDLSREVNAGNGPVDFKLSIGYKGRILVEVKKSSNSSHASWI